MRTLIKRHILRRLILTCTICQCPSPWFTDNRYSASWRHSDRNNAAINNRYLDLYKGAVWFRWSMIIIWTTTLMKFCVCILRLDCKQSTKNEYYILRGIHRGYSSFWSKYQNIFIDVNICIFTSARLKYLSIFGHLLKKNFFYFCHVKLFLTSKLTSLNQM